MSEPLRILHVEDSESDAALVVRLLEKAGYSVTAERVEDAGAMRAALAGQPWDVIVCDYRMPQFDAPAALQVLRETGQDIPFIVVSGNIGEDAAVAMMKSGAHDYILKDGLARLAPAVEREIREARVRRKRREAEKALRESEERLAMAVDATRLGAFDYHPRSGRLIWSEYAKRHFGLPAHARVSYDIFMRGIHPEDRDRVHRMVQSALRPENGGHFAAEFRTIGIEDGIERWLASSGKAHFDDEGHAVRFVGMTLDITQRRRAEETTRAALREEEKARRLLDAVFAAHTDGLLVCDPSGRVIRINPASAAFFGFDPTGMELRAVVEKIGIKGGIEASATARALRGEITVNAEQVAGERVLETSSAPMRDDAGRIVGAVTITRDITERKRSEERLRQSQKLESIGLLAGGIAHDFNNLLTAVSGNISLVLETGTCPNCTNRANLETALDAVDRAAGLTRQLLAYAGKGAFVRRTISVNEVAESTVQLLRASLSKKLEIRTDLEPGLPPLLMDPSQLQQILMNLIVNGAEAIGDSRPGIVTVRTSRLANEVSIEVSDTGCGMDLETQKRIFDPFYTTKFVGRGLGLAAVDGIVRSLNGAIAIDSAPGRGTRMRVLLPLPSQPEPAPEAPPIPETASRKSNGAVLIVDDEPVIRNLARSVLERRGIEVFEASTGLGAIEALTANRPKIQVMLLDLSMPELNGNEALPRILEMCPELHVVVTSGYSDLEVKRRFRESKYRSFLPKPFTATQLLTHIDQALTGNPSLAK